MKQEQMESVATAAGKSTWLGAWTAGVFGGLSINESLGIAGFCLALISAIVNWYFRRKADQRAQRLHNLREKRLLAGKSDHGSFDELEADE